MIQTLEYHHFYEHDKQFFEKNIVLYEECKALLDSKNITSELDYTPYLMELDGKRNGFIVLTHAGIKEECKAPDWVATSEVYAKEKFIEQFKSHIDKQGHKKIVWRHLPTIRCVITDLTEFYRSYYGIYSRFVIIGETNEKKSTKQKEDH